MLYLNMNNRCVTTKRSKYIFEVKKKHLYILAGLNEAQISNDKITMNLKKYH